MRFTTGDTVVIVKSVETSPTYTRMIGFVGEVEAVEDDMYSVGDRWWYDEELDHYVEIHVGDFAEVECLI